MKIYMRLTVLLFVLGVFGLVLESALARGGRGGGGGGGRGGGGGARPSGGGARPSGGGGGFSRPSGGGGGANISRPSGGGGAINRSPSVSTPNISRPSGGGLGGGVRDNPGVVSLPKVSPGTRPSIGSGPGIGSRPGIDGKGIGSRPGIDGKGIGSRPGIDSKGIGSRPGIDGKGIGSRPGIDGKGIANRPGIDGKLGTGQRPGVLPGLGLGAAAGAGLANRDLVGRRQDNIQDRKANIADRSQNLNDRLSSRQDFWNQSQQDRQDYLNNRREDWQNWANDYHGHHDGWHHGNWCDHWHGEGWWHHMWQDHTAAMIFGTTMWGLNRLGYWFGYDSYSNPYYSEPIPVGDAYLDYSVPLAEPPTAPAEIVVTPDQAPLPPGVTKDGMKHFEAAQTAFYEGRYQDSLQSVNKALVSMPKDAVMHEFRALVLFALGNYREAAATLHPVLAVGPGWDWTTMSSLYPSTDTYTNQLRKLEGFVADNPKLAEGHFVLAYHYMTCGHTESAENELKQVRSLMPKDTVSGQLQDLLSAPATTPEPKQPPKTSDVKIDQAALIGTWTASRPDKATFELTLAKDKGFTWIYRQGKTKQEAKGAFSVDGNTLALEPDAGGVMLADITEPRDGAFVFRPIGAAKDDPGLRFQRK